MDSADYLTLLILGPELHFSAVRVTARVFSICLSGREETPASLKVKKIFYRG
jgi:hypothetical protein